MSVLEGGIYFDELAGLPSRHLALLVLGLVLALLGAIFMGIAGFIAGAIGMCSAVGTPVGQECPRRRANCWERGPPLGRQAASCELQRSWQWGVAAAPPRTSSTQPLQPYV